ncbi:MAG: histidinol-phosphate transaminase [Candidatus Omnitrophota bacterium]|nr:MAG: histidinol-phosphate transaminase [Candidatus Omnitrophota bacterium]
MENLVRRNIKELTPYMPGKPIEETRRELGLKEVIKLASNENPLGASPKACQAIKKAASSVNRYPDSSSFYLKRKIADSLLLSPDTLVLGNGSDELIEVILKTFTEEDDNIVTSQASFLEYEIISEICARKLKKAPLKDFRYDLKAIRGLIDEKTKVVFVANPNNPTGTYVNRNEIEEFLSGLPEGVILVLDEAYDTFIDVEDFPRGLDYIFKKNVIVLKTFSKAYGLAGLRVGYAVLRPEAARYMEKARQPFNVNLLAQQAAFAALDDRKFLNKTREAVLKGKEYLYTQLKKLNIDFVPSVANFILVDIKKDCLEFFKEMLKYGVIVRDMSQYGLNNFIRVTIGTARENKRFIEVLKKIL